MWDRTLPQSFISFRFSSSSDATLKLIFPLTPEGLLSEFCVLEPLGVQTNRKFLANTSLWTGSGCSDLGVDELWDGRGRGGDGLDWGVGWTATHSPMGPPMWGGEAFRCLHTSAQPRWV